MKYLLANAAVALVAILLSGCAVPFPYRSDRTPDISGRVVDSSTHLPVSHATLQFMGPGTTMLRSPKATTDETGEFHLQKTRNGHLFTIGFPPHGWSWTWPDGSASTVLHIEHSGYLSKTLNLRDVFAARGLSNRQNNFDIMSYDGTVSLGDILLDR